MEPTVLVIEDDRDITQVVRTYLEHAGFHVGIAYDGLSGLGKALADPPTLIILDWMLPGLSGLEVMRRLRSRQHTPVIMLTARGEEADRIAGLELGADDYVSKPFSPRELLARVKAVLRRSETSSEGREAPLRRGLLELDPLRRSVTLAGQALELSTLEFDLLFTLARQPGRVFRRDELLERAWGSDFQGVDRVVDVHISNLRQKLETLSDGPPLLITVRGVGYKFTEEMS